MTEQFQRAIRSGAIATLDDTLKRLVLEAYAKMGRANQFLSGLWSTNTPGARPSAIRNAVAAVQDAKPAIHEARQALLQFLSSEV